MTIRELRREKGLTQGKLGEILGVSPKTIAAYESGKTKPGARVAARIRELYGVAVETAGKTAEQAAPQIPERQAEKQRPGLIRRLGEKRRFNRRPGA